MKISIVTVSFNSAATIRDTIESVLGQTYSQIEYVVIDGASTDATMDIVREYGDRIHRVVSEPDQGIYDAMNKGLNRATGEVIGMLNADDFYPSSNTLTKVGGVFNDPEVEACYGDLLYVKEVRNREKGVQKELDNLFLFQTGGTSVFNVVRYWKSGKYALKKFYWGWMLPHPTFFVRRSVYERYGDFNLNLGSAADYEMMIRLLVKHGIRTAYIPEVLAVMRTGGISNASARNRVLANIMDRKAWEVNGLKPLPWTLWLKPFRKIHQYFVKP